MALICYCQSITLTRNPNLWLRDDDPYLKPNLLRHVDAANLNPYSVTPT